METKTKFIRITDWVRDKLNQNDHIDRARTKFEDMSDKYTEIKDDAIMAYDKLREKKVNIVIVRIDTAESFTTEYKIDIKRQFDVDVSEFSVDSSAIDESLADIDNIQRIPYFILLFVSVEDHKRNAAKVKKYITQRLGLDNDDYPLFNIYLRGKGIHHEDYHDSLKDIVRFIDNCL